MILFGLLSPYWASPDEKIAEGQPKNHQYGPNSLLSQEVYCAKMCCNIEQPNGIARGKCRRQPDIFRQRKGFLAYFLSKSIFATTINPRSTSFRSPDQWPQAIG
jgi:hypothetical protein